MLLKLVSAWQQGADGSDAVVSLRDEGTIGAPLRQVGADVRGLGLAGPSGIPGAARGLWAAGRELDPGIVQGWMYHGNLGALLLARAAPGRVPCIWSIRQTLYDVRREKAGTARVIRLGARLSRRASRIVYNSALSATQHEAVGYASRGRVVIPNGFDTGRFAPAPSPGEELRKSLGVPPSALVIGMAARDHPMKNHAGLIRAAGATGRQDVWLLLAGRGISDDNPALATAVRDARLGTRVRLLGELGPAALPGFYSACDLVACASLWGEGFPNVLGEAMACGVPCVTTDIGDSSTVVGTTGIVVPPDDDAALQMALTTMLALTVEERRALGAQARARIIREFSLAGVAEQFLALYREVSAEHRAPRTS